MKCSILTMKHAMVQPNKSCQLLVTRKNWCLPCFHILQNHNQYLLYILCIVYIKSTYNKGDNNLLYYTIQRHDTMKWYHTSCLRNNRTWKISCCIRLHYKYKISLTHVYNACSEDWWCFLIIINIFDHVRPCIRL